MAPQTPRSAETQAEKARLGHIPGSSSFLELPRFLRDPLEFLESRHQQHGDLFKTRWIVPAVFALGPEANRQILITELKKFSYEGAYRDLAVGRLFANSILVEDGEQHRLDRELLQPAMLRVSLQESLDPLHQIWDRIAEELGPGAVLDPYSFSRRVTFEVAAKLLLGVDLKDEGVNTIQLLEVLLKGALAHTRWRVPLGKLDRGLRARGALLQWLVRKLELARSSGGGSGLLGLLAKHRDAQNAPLSNSRIAEHLLLLFWAGYDTTAATASWLFYHLALSQRWQDRLREEQRTVLRDSAFTLAELDRLSDHLCVLREIERLRPAVLFFPRRTKEKVAFYGSSIPPGTLVFYSAYLTHRMSRLFQDPNMFAPERWEPGGSASASNLVGFGGGTRVCLGKTFALLQLKVMLVSLLQRFRLRLEPGDELRPIALPIYRPSGIRIRLSALT